MSLIALGVLLQDDGHHALGAVCIVLGALALALQILTAWSAAR